MKLYIGAAGSGQAGLAALETGRTPTVCTAETALRADAIADYHLLLRELMLAGESAEDYTRRLIAENPDAVVVCDEIGLGIVPLDPFERRWREGTGRALCLLASHAERVTRVYYGLGQVIK